MRCLAIQHVAFEDLGTFAPFIKQSGYALNYYLAGINLPTEAAWLNADLAVVLGGPIGVNDAQQYPFLQKELDLVKMRLHSNKPLLGICLGAQMIAAALGAAVYPGERKEIGWGNLNLTPAGKTSALRHLENAPVLHWHGDTFDLPKEVSLLASTTLTPHQAFSLGTNVLALQFHAEIDANTIESWLIGHTAELNQAHQVPNQIRNDSLKYADAARFAGQKLFQEWFQQLHLS